MIPLTECKDRHVYRLRSRNLRYGVFREATGGFIGIRTKFGNRYLFEEYHHDQGAPYGTATPEQEEGRVPDGCELRCDSPTIDHATGRLVRFDGRKLQSKGPARIGSDYVAPGRGWVFIDTDEPSDDIQPVSKTYRPLFLFLDEYESENTDRTWLVNRDRSVGGRLAARYAFGAELPHPKEDK